MSPWQHAAACADADPRIFDDDSTHTAQAISICHGCPARAECLADAITSRTANGIHGGIMFHGGKPYQPHTPRRLRRQRTPYSERIAPHTRRCELCCQDWPHDDYRRGDGRHFHPWCARCRAAAERLRYRSGIRRAA